MAEISALVAEVRKNTEEVSRISGKVEANTEKANEISEEIRQISGKVETNMEKLNLAESGKQYHVWNKRFFDFYVQIKHYHCFLE